jgi:CheY-like chemotaxis protein
VVHLSRYKEVFMFSNRIDLSFPLALIEMLARVGSIASIILLLMLFAGEGLHPSELPRNEWIGLLFFPLGVMIGMVIAWWKEGVGAVVTMGCLLGFYLVWGYLLRNHIGGWAFVVFASPSFLFHILFADDESDIRELVQSMLQAAGFLVSTSDNAADVVLA